VALKDGVAAPSADELKAWCKDHMAHFKRPHYIVFGELPKTVTGKVQKYVLREKAKEIRGR
jgi:fatty-acyl-CoA synthase